MDPTATTPSTSPRPFGRCVRAGNRRVRQTRPTEIRHRNGRPPRGKVVLLIQLTVYIAGDAGGHRANRGTPAGEQYDDHQLLSSDIVECPEPAEMGVIFAAGAGLAGDRLLLASAARGAVLDCGAHAR